MKTKAFLIAGAAASLLLTGAVTARAAEGEGNLVPCLGINACKGQGSCRSVNNECAGKNGCKGQGVTKTTAAECKAKGGTIREDKK